jgi:hypothetical protein
MPHAETLTGAAIGDMVRHWEMNHGRLSDRRHAAAFTAARTAVDALPAGSSFTTQRRAAMAAISATLTVR